MEYWVRYLDAARRFVRAAEMVVDVAPEATPILAHRAIEHMIMALAYKFTPDEAVALSSHGRRRSWLSRFIHSGRCPRRLLTIFDELDRIYKRGTYLLENGELARKALILVKEALSIVEELLGVKH